MRLAVRTAKADRIIDQLSSVIGVSADAIATLCTKYDGITMISLSGTAMSTLDSIRNIEALLLDEEAAAKLKQSSTAGETLSFESLDGVDEREQYEHLSQLLHIQKATRYKR